MDAEGFSGLDGRTTIFDYWGVKSLQKLCSDNVSDALTPEEKALYDYHRQIIRLCRDHEAIHSGTFYDLQYANYNHEYGYNCDRQYAFFRHSAKGETLLVAVNFDATAVHVGINIPDHAYEYLHMRPGMVSALDLLSGNTQTIELKHGSPVYVEIPAYGAVVLSV